MSETSSLDELRKSLKQWESAFVIVHRRKPNKDDIETAPQDIRDKYQLYHKAKRSSLSRSTEKSLSTDPHPSNETQDSTGSLGDVDVWSVKLNKINTEKTSPSTEHKVKDQTSQGLLEKMGSKLFQNACTSGINSSFSRKKEKGYFARPTTNESSAPPIELTSSPEIAISTYAKSRSTSKDTPVLQTDASNSIKQVQKLEQSLSLGSVKTVSSNSDVHKDSDVIMKGTIFKHAEKFLKHSQNTNKSLNTFTLVKPASITKKSRMSFLSKDLSKLRTENCDEYDEPDGDLKLKPTTFQSHCSDFNKGKYNFSEDLSNNKQNFEGMNQTVLGEEKVESTIKTAPEVVSTDFDVDMKLRKNPRSKSSTSSSAIAFRTHEEERIVSQKDNQSSILNTSFESRSKAKNKTNLREKPNADENCGLRHTDKSKEIPNQTEKLINAKSVSIRQSSDIETEEVIGRPRKRKAKILDDAEEEEMDVSSQNNVQDIRKRETSVPTLKPAAPKKATVSKKSSASLNENFVSLNMKKKGYRRKGAAGLTPGQLKKKQWKAKMSSRSQSFGSNKCFKCGQEGHWANKCKGKATSNRGGFGSTQTDGGENRAPVEESDFPSLRQAANMARGTSDKTEQDESNESDIMDIEASIVRERLMHEVEETTTRPGPVKPLISTLHDWQEEVKRSLAMFGFSNFRPGQEESITRILKGLSTLVVLSTGAGKSLCYQLPAYMYAKHAGAITLVISPLVSLMEDQVSGLPAGIHGACLHSGMSQSQRDSVTARLREGKVHFLLVSPEALVEGGRIGSSLPQLPPIAFACIDEAHCLSEWSHNFRPSYLRLCKVLRSHYNVQCFLGLTATATRSTARDVARHLGVGDDNEATVRGAAVPTNLVLSSSRDQNRDEALINLLKGPRFGSCRSIIIYCSRREQTTRVATLIRTSLQTSVDLSAPFPAPPPAKKTKRANKKDKKSSADFDPSVWTAESYHAGLSAAKRRSVQNAFMSGKLRVVAATVAFGMGLDKADVRAVLHYSMSRSFEAFVQEIGRAGRDGERADCHVFLDSENRDEAELRRHTFANSVDRSSLKKLLSSVFAPCRCVEVFKWSQRTKTAQEIPENVKPGGECGDDSTQNVDNSTLLDPDEGQQDRRLKQDSNDGEKPSDINAADDESSDYDCPGHERALPIESTVQRLDVKEEGIATLLCYLELKYPESLEMMTPVYSRCSIRCYGGPAQLHATAKKCPPVAVAIAKQKLLGKKFSDTGDLEFDIIALCDSMGWNSGPVKRELKQLQWVSGPSGFRKSGVMVELSDLAFHFRSRGDLSADQMDDVVDFLTSRAKRQERTELHQLEKLSLALRKVSHKNYWMCSEEVDIGRSDRLKADLEDFFEVERHDDSGDDEAKEALFTIREPDASLLGQLQSDIRHFISLYGQDHTLSGRSIARVLHGISSPNFPAETWGRVRRFWRSYLNVDFPVVMNQATKLVVSMR